MPYCAPIDTLAAFQQRLVGVWENRDFGENADAEPVGGTGNPMSYNIMPLPEPSDPDGYILKNFKYHERLKFNDNDPDATFAIAAVAPNRGGFVSQNARALFYEQQVRFAEGPAAGEVVHVENGSWLALPRYVQQTGPYPSDINGEPVVDALGQPTDIYIAKQIGVPHGNSVLALGGVDTIAAGNGTPERHSIIAGSPVIPDLPLPYPTPAAPAPNDAPSPSVLSKLNCTARYTTDRSSPGDFQNPHPDLTQFPGKPLQSAVAIIAPDAYMHWQVTTEPRANGRGHVTDVPFEMRVSDVTDYRADYWLMFKGGNRYLAYTQTILMTLTIKDVQYTFPHVTCNVVTFVGE